MAEVRIGPRPPAFHCECPIGVSLRHSVTLSQPIHCLLLCHLLLPLSIIIFYHYYLIILLFYLLRRLQISLGCTLISL